MLLQYQPSGMTYLFCLSGMNSTSRDIYRLIVLLHHNEQKNSAVARENARSSILLSLCIRLAQLRASVSMDNSSSHINVSKKWTSNCKYIHFTWIISQHHIQQSSVQYCKFNTALKNKYPNKYTNYPNKSTSNVEVRLKPKPSCSNALM